MRIRYPLTVMVPGEYRRWATSSLAMETQGWRRWGADWERDVDYYAPRWVAWLYRWLPVSIVWLNQPEHQKAQEGAYFLWQVLASRWCLGWLPAARTTYRNDPSPPRWGELVYGVAPHQRLKL